MAILKRKKDAMLYDSIDLIGALFIIGIALFLAGVIIYGQRLETIDQKFVLEENLEILDEFMRFISLPLDSFSYDNFKPTSSPTQEKIDFYNNEYSVYHLFSLIYTDYYAYELLDYLISENSILSKYQVHLPTMSLNYIYFDENNLDKESLYDSYEGKQTFPFVPVVSSSSYSSCGLGKSEKRLVFSLPLIYNDKSINEPYEIRYCHKLNYFDSN